MKTPKVYRNLFWMALLHLIVMYFIMFAMVDTLNDVVMNLNTFYMALMMMAPMLLMMPLSMLDMYPNKKWNIIVLALSLFLIVGSYIAIRKQVLIEDKQFIKSMIPHHSGAILMCQQAEISDPELRTLCDDIIRAQREEIEQMRKILQRIP